MLRIWTILWIIITIVLGYESFALNNNPKIGLLYWMQTHNWLSATLPLTAEPGRPISYWQGWIGFSLMLLTNLYILRKRVSLFSGLGRLSNWLDFHIFCGLVGPTFILFHCNFKVGGLVGISFWSMVISFASGVIGRYFYVNLLSKKRDSVEAAQAYWEKFLRRVKRAKIDPEAPEVLNAKVQALNYVGFAPAESGVLNVFVRALIGDIRCIFRPPATLPGMSLESAHILEAFAMHQRRAEALGPFQKLMGYWHTFHTPFAIFMYVVAVIHIMSALFFGV